MVFIISCIVFFAGLLGAIFIWSQCREGLDDWQTVGPIAL